MTKLNGVDISGWQGDVNFDKLVKATDFVICKVSEGSSFIDPKFARNKIEARRVGLDLGYYHFARADLGNTPEVEADFFLKTIGDIREKEMLFLDFEVSFDDIANWCLRFLNHVSERLGGYKPLIYLNQSQVKNHDWDDVIAGNYGLWLAAYLATLPKTPWEVVAFQQTSSSGAVSGISGKVDTNVFFGDKEALAKYGYQSTAPVPQPSTDLKSTTIDWFDEEGNSHPVGWYVSEWYNEKQERSKAIEDAIKWKELYESLQKDGSSLRQDLLSKDKTITIITNEKNALKNELVYAEDELDKMRVQNLQQTKKIEELQVIIDKSGAKLGLLEKNALSTSTISQLLTEVAKRFKLKR
jgi:GH25 family lysozyme M1 (1,4-beta-N-acetylmuramidase)